MPVKKKRKNREEENTDEKKNQDESTATWTVSQLHHCFKYNEQDDYRTECESAKLRCLGIFHSSAAAIEYTRRHIKYLQTDNKNWKQFEIKSDFSSVVGTTQVFTITYNEPDEYQSGEITFFLNKTQVFTNTDAKRSNAKLKLDDKKRSEGYVDVSY